jgi:hypothetical protein
MPWPRGVAQAEMEAAQAEGRADEKITLPDGRVLSVPIGADFATLESTGEQFQIKWTQDEQGNIDVLSWHPVAPTPAAAAAEAPQPADSTGA